MSSWSYKTQGIDDGEFIRGSVPMTKSEVRAITLSKLKIDRTMDILDIGAGTGSVSIEAALAGKRVTAVERDPEGVDLIKKNAEKFSLNNIDIIQGLAPIDLPSRTRYQRVFIGGSGGKLSPIFEYLNSALEPNGVVVANTITVENTGKILALLKEYNYRDIEIVSVNISRNKKVGPVNMMMAENPITIISGVKGSSNE